MLLSKSTNGMVGSYGILHTFISVSEDNTMDDIFVNAETKCKVGLKTKQIETIVLVNTLVHIFLKDYLSNIISVYRKINMIQYTNCYKYCSNQKSKPYQHFICK